MINIEQNRNQNQERNKAFLRQLEERFPGSKSEALSKSPNEKPSGGEEEGAVRIDGATKLKWKEVQEKWPERKSQAERLAALYFGSHMSPGTLQNSILVGNTATGKTGLLMDMLGCEEFKIPFVYVNCQECADARNLYAMIAQKVLRRIVIGRPGALRKLRHFMKRKTQLSADKFFDFLVFAFLEDYPLDEQKEEPHEKGVVQDSSDDEDGVEHQEECQASASKTHTGASTATSLLVVLDRADASGGAAPASLAALFAYFNTLDREGEGMNFGLCLISDGVCSADVHWDRGWEITPGNHSVLNVIEFHDYSYKEIIDILIRDWKIFPMNSLEYGNENFYKSLVYHLMSLGRSTVTNLRTARRILQSLYKEFVTVCSKSGDVKAALREIEPRLMWEIGHPLEVLSGYPGRQGASGPSGGGARAPPPCPALPRMGQYLLAACFLASHNPAATDGRYFTAGAGRRRGKRRRRGGRAAAAAGEEEEGRGPQWFPLERALNILISVFALHEGTLADARASGTAALFAQLATLETLGLVGLSRDAGGRGAHPPVGGRGGGGGGREIHSLSALFFTCHCSLEMVSAICAGLGFSVSKYLHHKEGSTLSTTTNNQAFFASTTDFNEADGDRRMFGAA